MTLSLLLTFFLFSTRPSPIIVMELPAGELVWTMERPENAKMCIPAAFSDSTGAVVGEYRIGGKSYNANNKLKISIRPDIFYVDRKWHSDSGFQQLVLVYNDRPTKYKDTRKFVRRALCKKGSHVFLVESRHRMTLTAFAKECAKISSNAIYLDMGKYGYGHIGSRILSPWALFYKDRQTNWICVI